ncbi:MAG: V-type ATPase subunit [Candidatus Coatesbacteria bacterium]|nr:V-type ATPase subunit [Candidatus Coatesbacteria bacterium]
MQVTGVSVIARVHARKSYFLNKSDFEELLSFNFNQAADWLFKHKGYQGLIPVKGKLLDWQTRVLLKEVSLFSIWAQGKFYETLKWFVGQKELINIKIAIRYLELEQKIKPEDLVDIGSWSYVRNGELADIQSINNLMDLYIKKPIYNFLKNALERYKNHKNLGFLETELDSEYYKLWISSTKSSITKNILNSLISWKNLETLIRCREIYKLDWIDAANLFAYSKEPFTLKVLSELYLSAFNQWKVILPYPFRNNIEFMKSEDINYGIILPLKKEFVSRCRSLITQSSFKPEGSLAFLYLKSIEIENIALCLQGIDMGFSKDEILGELVYV